MEDSPVLSLADLNITFPNLPGPVTVTINNKTIYQALGLGLGPLTAFN